LEGQLVLKDNNIKATEEFSDFIRYITHDAETDDIYILFSTIDDISLEYLHDIDERYWKTLITIYSEWVIDSNFRFEFCDVLAQRLQIIFGLGDIAIKVLVILAAAKLGESHNRWYVMERVLKMCGCKLDDIVAERLCIDIKAFELEATFRTCADMLTKPYSAYHPFIEEIIETKS